jgi:hypothetical protein
LNPKNLNEKEVKEEDEVIMRQTFAALEILEDNGSFNKAGDNTRGNIKISAH